MPEYHVRIAGDDLVFSASHFLALPGEGCEPLHGHDYRVTAEVRGPLGTHHYVVDFHALSDMLRAIINSLDHRVLLATGGKALRIETDSEQVQVAVGKHRWVFPRTDCVLLPIATTTSELLAEYVGRQLFERLKAHAGVHPTEVRLEIHESRGFSAVCVLSDA